MSDLLIEVITTGQLGANCYLAIDKSSGNTLIIDPGDDALYLIQYIKDLDVKPKKIIATHGHFDHIMAALELQLSYKIPFMLSKEDESLVQNMQQSAKHFIGIESGPPPNITSHINSSSILKFENHSFDVLPTPGHTPGSISLYNKKEKIVFVGDVIFAGGGIGRYDFSYSDSADLSVSVNKLLSLPENTIVYPGHGLKTTIKQEKNYHHKS